MQYVLRDLLKDLSFVDTFLDEILVREGEIESSVCDQQNVA